MLMLLIRALRDDRFDSVCAKPAPDTRIAVSFVGGEPLRTEKGPATGIGQTDFVHQSLEAGGLVLLAWCQMHRQDDALAVREHMNLGAEPATGAA